MSLLKSKGFKRLGASALIAVAGVTSFVPGLSVASDYLAHAAGALGAVGIGHAAVSKKTASLNLATIAAFLAALSEVMKFIPSLAPYSEYVKWLAGALGAGAVGGSLIK